MVKQQVPVSARALLQRINRKLRWSGRALKRARTGDCLLVDMERDFMVRSYPSLEDCGRELGVLKPFEILSAGQTADMWRMHQNGMSLTAIGKQYGVSRQRIHQILRQMPSK